jgi:hypothetical protein
MYLEGAVADGLRREVALTCGPAASATEREGRRALVRARLAVARWARPKREGARWRPSTSAAGPQRDGPPAQGGVELGHRGVRPNEGEEGSRPGQRTRPKRERRE